MRGRLQTPWDDLWIPEPNSGCHLWLGKRTKKGYSLINRGGKQSTAHRYAWEMVHGPIPAEKWVLHKCDTPGCVNPAHLFLGTPKDNMDDKVSKGRDRVPVRLHEREVEEIRRLHALGVTQRLLSRMFRTSNQHISKIIHYQRRDRPWITQ